MHPVGIGETLHHAIAKLVMRAVGDQAKIACGSLQLCAGIESGIEGATHIVAQRQRERYALDPGSGEDKLSEGTEDKGESETSGTERTGETERLGGTRETTQPPRERSIDEEGERGEDGASDNLRTAMAGMEVG